LNHIKEKSDAKLYKFAKRFCTSLHEGRSGEDRRYAMRCGKILELGWRPLIKLSEGLAKTIEWYTRNEWWWRPLVDELYVLSDTPWRR